MLYLKGMSIISHVPTFWHLPYGSFRKLGVPYLGVLYDKDPTN